MMKPPKTFPKDFSVGQKALSKTKGFRQAVDRTNTFKEMTQHTAMRPWIKGKGAK